MRHTIYIEENWNDDAGNKVISTRRHLITLSNGAASNRIVAHFIDLEWLDDFVSEGDVLIYNEEID